MAVSTRTHDRLKNYYGRQLKATSDLKSNACCTDGDRMTPLAQAALRELNDEIVARFYGCGSPLPPALEGCTVLDLGCGTGRDAYIAAKLVGPQGRVIGVDMTAEQLAIAQRNVESQMQRFGYSVPNVEFLQGYIEDLDTLGIADNSVDVVISNCVINLSPDKPAVFSEIFRVLKPGGELYVADVFAGRRIPAHLQDDPVLHGECLAGALYREDFRRMLQSVGCPEYRVVSSRAIALGSTAIEAKIGMVDFYSTTVRAFKLASLEDICEDYGQIAVYKGSVPEWPHYFDLDDHHRFLAGKPMPVCGNTAAMVQDTRYGKHFTVTGDRTVHYGAFDCSPASAMAGDGQAAGGACC